MDHPRDIIVSMRLTAAEAAHIDTAAAALARPRPRADYCRAAALHAAKSRVPPPAKPVRRPARRLPAFDTRLLAQILGQVGKLGGDVHNLATLSRRTGADPAASTIAALLKEIAAIRLTLITTLQGGAS